MLASRMDIAAHGVGLPGHFVVAVGHRGEQRICDPFYSGRVLTLEACAQLVAQTTGYRGPLQDAWLAPVAAREIITRMLRNLRTIYLQAGQWSAVQCVLEHLCLVDPGTPDNLRDLGLVLLQRRQTERGLYYLEAYLRAAPDAADRVDLEQGMKDHLQRVIRLN
jgi:regulator of sirC expression with transglutaminase-like and TPR domain